ncbi:unnamed protein product [Mycetohabitans rhizoxinica HKI 454]|uniref:Uncharacterized protein n=1 Tax=Mycetohabitans rhizoxinica (strain DSM 19002 / CIP 109453 / HKI 454) TaxID=882378 RepID=E5APW9_MYCRK|nr:unnamed protein product [Mycetohabitans rhizoxinica HKI 454]
MFLDLPTRRARHAGVTPASSYDWGLKPAAA